MLAVGARPDSQALAAGTEGGGQRARSIRRIRGRLWRGAPPRAEQPADRDSGKRGTPARGGSPEKLRQAPARRRTAAGNNSRASHATAGNHEPAEPAKG